jgi:hypothetical protein
MSQACAEVSLLHCCCLDIMIMWLYSPNRALASPVWGFVTVTFLRGWIVSPAPNPQPGRPGLRIMTPGDRVTQLYPQALGTHLVAFYVMHGLQWDYSLMPATTRDTLYVLRSLTFNVGLIRYFVCHVCHLLLVLNRFFICKGFLSYAYYKNNIR